MGGGDTGSGQITLLTWLRGVQVSAWGGPSAFVRSRGRAACLRFWGGWCGGVNQPQSTPLSGRFVHLKASPAIPGRLVWRRWHPLFYVDNLS